MNENKITGLAIWNVILSILVFMLMVALWSTQEDLKTLAHENATFLELLDQMVETDERLATLSERHSVLIADLFGYVDNLQKLALSNDVRLTSNDFAIAEIYQGHIIPLRAFHMENFNDPD